MSTRSIMLMAAAWTLMVWGTRIPLLEADATTGDWVRIGIGLAAGAAVGLAGLRYPAIPDRARGWINVAFAFAMVFLWLPSLLSVWTTEHSLGFRTVHTLLAGVSMGFGVVLAQRAQDTFRSTPQSSTSTM